MGWLGVLEKLLDLGGKALDKIDKKRVVDPRLKPITDEELGKKPPPAQPVPPRR